MMIKTKKVIKGSPKKIIAFTLVFAMLLSYVLPTPKVFASNEYVLSFSTNGNHIIENDGGHLKIDGQYVDLRDANDETTTIGNVECNGNACKITVSDGTTGKLNYNSVNKFTLYMQGHSVNGNEVFNANESFAVQDYENQILIMDQLIMKDNKILMARHI